MRRLAILIGGTLLVALGAADQAPAQLTYPPSPCSVLSAEPCHPAVCSVFRDGHCFPGYGALVGQTQRMKVAASEETAKEKPLKDRRDVGQYPARHVRGA